MVDWPAGVPVEARAVGTVNISAGDLSWSALPITSPAEAGLGAAVVLRDLPDSFPRAVELTVVPTLVQPLQPSLPGAAVPG